MTSVARAPRSVLSTEAFVYESALMLATNFATDGLQIPAVRMTDRLLIASPTRNTRTLAEKRHPIDRLADQGRLCLYYTIDRGCHTQAPHLQVDDLTCYRRPFRLALQRLLYYDERPDAHADPKLAACEEEPLREYLHSSIDKELFFSFKSSLGGPCRMRVRTASSSRESLPAKLSCHQVVPASTYGMIVSRSFWRSVPLVFPEAKTSNGSSLVRNCWI